MIKDRQPGLGILRLRATWISGEIYDACAVREVREEIGLTFGEPPGGFSNCPPPWKRTRNMFGFTAAKPKDLSRCTRRRLSAVTGFAPRSHALDGGTAEEFASALLVIWKRLRSPENWIVASGNA